MEAAVAAVIAEGAVRTYDMGGTTTTMEMARGRRGKLTHGAHVARRWSASMPRPREGGEGE